MSGLMISVEKVSFMRRKILKKIYSEKKLNLGRECILTIFALLSFFPSLDFCSALHENGNI